LEQLSFSRQERINSIAETSVCVTGGLTQKQSLRGLSLNHLHDFSVLEVSILPSWQTFEVEDYSGIFIKALFSASAVFGPKGALSLVIGVKPRVFGSVSRNRIRLGNRFGCSSRNIEFASKWFGLQTNS